MHMLHRGLKWKEKTKKKKNDNNEEIKSADSETASWTFLSSSDLDIWYSIALMVLISVPETTDIDELKIT